MLVKFILKTALREERERVQLAADRAFCYDNVIETKLIIRGII